MKILVIGAGWYGCHLASIFAKEGHDITIIDKAGTPFTESSSKNQNRLHLGFHYPRSIETIHECQKGYPQFMSHYGFITEDISNNLYFIAEKDSYLTYSEYKHVMLTAGNSFTEVPIETLSTPLNGVGKFAIRVNERYINPIKAAAYFCSTLELTALPHVDDYTSIDTILHALHQGYDMILNCTFNHLESVDDSSYELFVTFLYHIPSLQNFAYTIMDGPFFSIYPYDLEHNIYTITHVKYCVYYRNTVVPSLIIEPTTAHLHEIRSQVEIDISRFIPSFTCNASYVSHYTSWKTKPNTCVDDRSVRITEKDNIITIYGGKITGIFEAESYVRSKLAGCNLG